MSKGSEAASKRLYITLIANQLVKDTPFKDLSVSAICEAADVSRSVFYTYFENKIAIPIWFQSQIHKSGIYLTGINYSWRDAIYVSTTGAVFFEPLLLSAGQCDGYQSLRETVYRQRRDNLLDTLTKTKHIKITDSLLFQIEFYSRAEVEMMYRWGVKKNRESVDDISDHLAHCVPSELFALLDKPIDPKQPRALDLNTILSRE